MLNNIKLVFLFIYLMYFVSTTFKGFFKLRQKSVKKIVPFLECETKRKRSSEMNFSRVGNNHIFFHFYCHSLLLLSLTIKGDRCKPLIKCQKTQEKNRLKPTLDILSSIAFRYLVWESSKKKLDALRYSLIIILVEILGLYKNSKIADFIITWKILSKLVSCKSSLKWLLTSSLIRSSLSIVPNTTSLINFLNLCLGKVKSVSSLKKLPYSFWIIITLYNYLKLKMKLKRFLLRFHPPGIILEYLKRSGEIETKSIDLLNLTPT